MLLLEDFGWHPLCLVTVNFRQGLSPNLHFRQFNGSKTRIVESRRGEVSRFCLYLRQVIASSRGKELVQVSRTLGNLMVPIEAFRTSQKFALTLELIPRFRMPL